MIRTHRQLKALVRNHSGGNSNKAQMLIRLYSLERFLERVSLSEYYSRFVLKGGVLIASILGLEQRSTIDLDATMRSSYMSVGEVEKMTNLIISISLDDGMSFIIKSTREIRSEADYPGVRVQLEATLDTMRIPLQIDFSWGDALTPGDVEYTYPLLFEERTISLRAYNVETVLAEKIESILTRDVTNTRMRDFYDIFQLYSCHSHVIDKNVLARAIRNTSHQRHSEWAFVQSQEILKRIESSLVLQQLLSRYQTAHAYAQGIEWSETVESIRLLLALIGS